MLGHSVKLTNFLRSQALALRDHIKGTEEGNGFTHLVFDELGEYHLIVENPRLAEFINDEIKHGVCNYGPG